MNKFIIKYFFIFLAVISLMFFSLIFFQQHNMEKEHQLNMRNHIEYFDEDSMMPMAPPPPQENPPLSIPVIFVLTISSILIYIVLNYINKNFVEPLTLVEENVSKIKDGLLNVKFETKSENNKVVETFDTMNEMVDGLKQREKLQDNFIRNLVHDLRAPVIAQERAMEILSEELKDNELVSGMVKNNDAYLKMINSVIESFSEQDIKIEKMDFNFLKLTNTVIDALKPVAEAKNIELKTSIQNDLTIYADYISFNRIIMNLVSNAIDNIDNNKTVTIRGLKKPDCTVIVIEDNGHGIKKEEKEKLFKNHVSINGSGKKFVSGLGLSIVYDLVMKNGGSIRIESEEEKYTKFIIELADEG